MQDLLNQDNNTIKAKSNKTLVLQLIRSKTEITRAEIIKTTGLSAPTVTRIIESLARMQLIQTIGTGHSIGGRRPQLIRFTAKENYVIGIDIGGTFIRSSLSNLDGEFIFEIQVPTNLKKGFETVMQQTGELIQKLTARAKQNNLRLWGIGIAICGMVNKNTRIVEYSPIFNWHNVDVKTSLAKYTNLNIAIGNVVQLFALGELLYGVGKKYSDFICVNIGYGIGSGIVSGGKLFGGVDGIAGEIGHIVVDKQSNREGLEGIKGTMEALSSGYGIADIAREQVKLNPDSILNKIKPKDMDAKSVFEAAKKNDALANNILNTAATNLCIGIDTLIKLFNTECIVLSGGLIESEALLFQKIQDNMEQFGMKAISRKVPLIQSSFGENAALMGSFSLILERILQLNFESFEN